MYIKVSFEAAGEHQDYSLRNGDRNLFSYFKSDYRLSFPVILFRQSTQLLQKRYSMHPFQWNLCLNCFHSLLLLSFMSLLFFFSFFLLRQRFSFLDVFMLFLLLLQHFFSVGFHMKEKKSSLLTHVR